MEYAVETPGVALVVAVDEPPRAAVADVPAVDRHRVLAGTEPLHEQLGLGVGAKDDVARSVEFTGDVDEGHAGRGIDLRGGHHSSLSCSGARPWTWTRACSWTWSAASSASRRSWLSSQ